MPEQEPPPLEFDFKDLRDEFAMSCQGFPPNLDAKQACEWLGLKHDPKEKVDGAFWARMDAKLKYLRADAMMKERKVKTK